MILSIGIRAPCEHICESSLNYIFFYVWFRYMAPRNSIFVMHMNCMYQSYNIYSWIDSYNYSFALIHGRCLSCKFFRDCNKEANHKIRFPHWFILFFVFFFHWCKIEIQEENKKNQPEKLHIQHCSRFSRYLKAAIWYGTTTGGRKTYRINYTWRSHLGR